VETPEAEINRQDEVALRVSEMLEGRAGGLCYVARPAFERLLAVETTAEQRARLFSTYCRINLLYMVARAGSGHPGTCLSSVDLMSWLYLNEIRGLDERDAANADVFLSSKGHDAPAFYAVLIALGLLDDTYLHKLRRLGGLPGHPHIETPHVYAGTGSLGMGISKAKGMITANRLLGNDRHVYVMTGDGELQEGQIWESLATAVRDKMGELTAIVDHNKIQSDTWVHEVSDVGDVGAKFAAFGWEVARCDGHDFAAIAEIMQRFRAITDRPKVLVADTVKGKGVSFMEGPEALEDGGLYLFHSGAPSVDQYDTAVREQLERAVPLHQEFGLGAVQLQWLDRDPHVKHAGFGNIHRLMAAYEDELVRQAEANDRIVVFNADLVKDCGLIAFEKRFPERFVECGIAEQDMVSQASGLAQMGLIPLCHSFACFLSTRPNEQIYNAATEHEKVIYTGSLAGLLPGGPGHSHQSVRDISALGAVPGLSLVEPCQESEVRQLLSWAINDNDASTYIRLCSMGWDMPFDLPADYALTPGRGAVVRDGDDGIVFGYGPWLLSNAYEAAELLARERGLELRVVNLPWLNRVDEEWLREVVGSRPWVIALDNHYEHGGQAEMLLAQLAESEIRVGARRLALDGIPECGTTQEVLEYHEFDALNLARRMALLIQGSGSLEAYDDVSGSRTSDMGPQ